MYRWLISLTAVVLTAVLPNAALADYWTDRTLGQYVRQHHTVILGEIVSVSDTMVPYVRSHANEPEYPPFPAKLYTVEVLKRFKGARTSTITVRQLVPSNRVVTLDGKPDPLMQVGERFLFFLYAPEADGTFQEAGARFAIGPDKKVNPMWSYPPLTAKQELTGLTEEQAVARLARLTAWYVTSPVLPVAACAGITIGVLALRRRRT